MRNIEISKRLSNFQGIYMSGFFIANPNHLTILSLLFNKVYLPNHMDFVLEFSERFKFTEHSILDEIDLNLNLNKNGIEDNNNLLREITKEQTETIKKYLFYSYRFCYQNRELFPEVFITDFVGKIENDFKIDLVEKGKDGNPDMFTMPFDPMTINFNGLKDISKKISNGYVPIMGIENNCKFLTEDDYSAKSIAALLAMKSVEMMLPPLKAANPQDILESRDRLSDFLPPFWSAMLKFSIESKDIIENSSSIEEAISECQNIVDLNIRPTLIDLNEKLIKEKKYRFYKILSNVGQAVKLIIGKPKLTNFDLLTTAISCSTDIGLDYMNHKKKIDSLKDEAGLTYLLKIGEYYK